MCVAKVRKVVSCRLLYVLFLLTGPATQTPAEVAVYPRPSIYTASPDFQVSVFQVDKDALGRTSQASTFGFTSGPDRKVQYSFSQFSFSGKVEVTITATSQKAITSFSISPLALNIPGRVKGNSLTFTLDRSRYLILKINGLKELILAADPAEDSPPRPSSKGVENITTAPYNILPNGRPSTAGNTSAQFAAAIKKASAENGTVYVPAGVFYINNIVLSSNVRLYLTGGSVLRSSNDTASMSKDFYKTSQGKGTWLISTQAGSQDVSITGRGMVDGDGYTMRNGANLSGGNLVDTLILANKTHHFTIDGIVAWNAGFWAVMPVRSDTILIKNFKALEALAPEGCKDDGKLCMYENDAMDIVESSDVLVTHTLAISQDDTYSTKTWAFPGSEALNLDTKWGGVPKAVKNVLIQDAVGWSGFDVFKIGGGIGQAQSNITFDQGYVYHAKRALDLFCKYGSATTSNITFKNLDIETTISTWASFTDPGGPVVGVSFVGINVRNTVGPKAGRQYMILPSSRPSHPISNVTITDVSNHGKRVESVSDLLGTSTADSITGLTITPYSASRSSKSAVVGKP
jgi:hypothetical protein